MRNTRMGRAAALTSAICTGNAASLMKPSPLCDDGGMFPFTDAAQNGQKLAGPREYIVGATYVGNCSAASRRLDLAANSLSTDAAQNGQKLEGPCDIIVGATYVEKFGGIVTYGDGGEMFLFTEAAQNEQKLEGPCENIRGATYVESWAAS